jgi:hypothetical protein
MSNFKIKNLQEVLSEGGPIALFDLEIEGETISCELASFYSKLATKQANVFYLGKNAEPFFPPLRIGQTGEEPFRVLQEEEDADLIMDLGPGWSNDPQFLEIFEQIIA